ncbi:MAG: hypothetical protein AB3N10_06220, partial [Allomuricauda sp.]
MGYSTSIDGWDERNSRLKKSVSANRNIDCTAIEQELNEKLYAAKVLVKELGSSLDKLDVHGLIFHIKEKWDANPNSEIRNKVDNQIS